MVNPVHVSLKAHDRSYFAILKKEVHQLAFSAGMSVTKVGEIDIIVAEMVSNLVKHGGGGNLLVKLVEEKNIQGIEIISIDNGPGMTDTVRMVSDGVSTKNTLGNGLGAMKRLADTFQVFSSNSWGTIILVRIFEKEIPLIRKPPMAEWRSVIIPKPGETASGDRFYSVSNNDCIKLFLGDGLGHGVEASKAVTMAGDAFVECDETDPVEIIRFINSKVKKTRGLVATVAVFSFSSKTWKICGVGNISTRIISQEALKTHTPYNGIIGLNVPNTLNSIEIEYVKGQHLIMCSDGLKSRWDLVKYPSIFRYDLSVLCSTLIKDYARNTDDMSVVACKINC